MPALPGQWGADSKRGPGQCDAAHQNGVGELPGEKELGRSDPRSQKLAPRSESSALERTATLTDRFLEAASLVIGESALSKTEKADTSLARQCPGGQKSLSELTEGSDSWLFQALLLSVTHTKWECTERPQY